MADTPPEPETIKGVWDGMRGTIAVLAVSGAAGALVRALLNPKQSWRKHLSRVIVGVLSAVFLGGLVASFMGNSTESVLAAGFVCGHAGEQLVEAIQRRVKSGVRILGK